MEKKPFIPIDQASFDYIKDNFDAKVNLSVQKVITFLQQKGFSKLEVAIIISEQTGLSVTEANRHILLSHSWN